MGRGIGSFQQHLLRQVEARSTQSVNELRWGVWERLGERGAMTKPFLSQTREALKKLEARGRVSSHRRHLRNLDEVVGVFPAKTLDPQLRASRALLLPDLMRFAARRPKYTPGEAEAFLLSDRRVAIAEASVKWMPLEQQLAEEVATASSRHWALPLMVKGRELFLEDGNDRDESFQDLLEVAERSTALPVIRDIRALFDALLPVDQRNVSRLRTQIHALIEMPHHGASHLRERAKRELSQRHDLRGHNVDRLVTREVLQLFIFVEASNRAAHRRSSTSATPTT